MTKKYKILAKYIKDMSSETPDIETYIFVRDYIGKYQFNIDINSKPLKDKMVEINTILKFEDKQGNKKKSYFEINYSSIVKIDEDITEKKHTDFKKMVQDVVIHVNESNEETAKEMKMKEKFEQSYVLHFLLSLTAFLICTLTCSTCFRKAF